MVYEMNEWNYYKKKKNGSKSSSVFFIPLILKPTESSRTQKVAKEERRMPGSVHPFTASRSFALREWRGKENAAQLLTVMKSGGWIPEACSVTVVSWIFKAEAWGAGKLRARSAASSLRAAAAAQRGQPPAVGLGAREPAFEAGGVAPPIDFSLRLRRRRPRDSPICPPRRAGAVRRVDPSAAR